MPKKARYKTCAEENCRKPMFKAGKCEEHCKKDDGQGTVDSGPKAEKKEEAKIEAKTETKKEEKVEAKKE